MARQAGNLIDRTLLKTTNVKGNWQATSKDMISVLWFNGAKEKFGRGTGQAQREARDRDLEPGQLLSREPSARPAEDPGRPGVHPVGLPFGEVCLLRHRLLARTAGGLDGQTTRDAVNSTTSGTTRGQFFLRPQHMFNVDGNWFLGGMGGSHDFKYGVGYRRTDAFAQTIWPGDKMQGRIESATNRVARLYREGAGHRPDRVLQRSTSATPSAATA